MKQMKKEKEQDGEDEDEGEEDIVLRRGIFSLLISLH